jgi:histidine triad (HIT) family protein
VSENGTSEDCIFCRIAAGAAPASIIAENPDALAFMDIDQPMPGHVLIIPRTHVRDIYELDDEVAAAVFRLTVQVAKAVKLALAPDGMNLLQANERAGQQVVFHFHMHVMARYFGDRDRIRLGWQNNHPASAELDRLAAEIRAAL